ncbi:MAG: hypothetical protein COV59_04655 [Candidatus Magasanikbacteria bacterium CG11_big_fil_rev_8_21_14_0_20_39_34]|uniref:Sugar 3,4-ketoisomerase QdtA cupin domain-containing protein n=1 Tax=Candidatus Magasanikbacteria bacterium CG11_big_fil_rev_8_21_14_0_20_39_34 TaxID=1974653 RepID=A0A2H0N4A8_9BACT|nr:MAG: hypothetical protein COV59_04655 [Candidatus Magasanikbacteria bacterium CG11_big_fil_rev_8_21_14_0_20_39_34]
MDGVRVTLLEGKKNKTEKGWNIPLLSYHADGVGIFFRRAGIISGKHYHKGNSPSRTPEKGILIDGKAKFYCKNLETGDEQETFVEAPVSWEIDPMIYHEMHMITDCTFIERIHEQDGNDFFFL